MRFAAHFRRPDVDAMLAELTPEQLAEWDEFCRLEPWGYGFERENFGIVAAMIANAAPFRGKGCPVFSPGMFDPHHAELNPAPREKPPEVAPPGPPSAHAERVYAQGVAHSTGGTLVILPAEMRPVEL